MEIKFADDWISNHHGSTNCATTTAQAVVVFKI